MDDRVAVHVPRQLVERLDLVAQAELRSRANAAAKLIDEGLRRREAGAQDDDRVESR